MIKIILIIIVCISFLFGVDSSFQAGVSFYDARSENSNGLVANSIQIDQAINEFKKVSQDQELDAGIYLLRCYYFKGKFVEQTEKNKKVIFNLGKSLGEELIQKYPNSAAVRYWYLANLGSWAEVYGLFAAAKEGVSDLMRNHSKKIIELDPNYWNGGGHFMLGAVHYKSPYIPFILSWPKNDKAVKYLTKAFDAGKSTSAQIVYLSRALYKDGQINKAKELLTNLIAMPLSEDEPTEDLEQQTAAKEYLSDWK
jgi:tetratricopeptide (TPR) repeat protein